MKDYYLILGIDPYATLEEIKDAYRKMSMKYHPDRNKGDKYFEERFKDIGEAYEVLIDTEKRKEYDYKWMEFYKKTNNTRKNEQTESNYQTNDLNVNKIKQKIDELNRKEITLDEIKANLTKENQIFQSKFEYENKRNRFLIALTIVSLIITIVIIIAGLNKWNKNAEVMADLRTQLKETRDSIYYLLTINKDYLSKVDYQTNIIKKYEQQIVPTNEQLATKPLDLRKYTKEPKKTPAQSESKNNILTQNVSPSSMNEDNIISSRILDDGTSKTYNGNIIVKNINDIEFTNLRYSPVYGRGSSPMSISIFNKTDYTIGAVRVSYVIKDSEGNPINSGKLILNEPTGRNQNIKFYEEGQKIPPHSAKVVSPYVLPTREYYNHPVILTIIGYDRIN